LKFLTVARILDIMLTKRICAAKKEQMGFKLLKIIANVLYDVCHRFGG